MRNKITKLAVKKAVILSILILTLANSASAQDKAPLDLKKVSVPKEFGMVREVYNSPVLETEGPKIIIHIQDVHANYQAQKNMANILEYLIKTYGLSLILVEGGITDKDFSFIKGWASLDERREKAEELLKKGVITGETYIDIATDYPLKFQGVEEKGLYEANMEAYLKIEPFRKEALNAVREFKEAARVLKGLLYSKRLKDFEEHKADYMAKTTGLIDYVQYLENTASKEGIALYGWPYHLILLETSEMEKGIHFDSARRESGLLIERLSTLLGAEGSNEIAAKGAEFKEGRISAGAFYSYLLNLAAEKKIDMDDCKNLNRYVDYIMKYEKLKPRRLFREIRKIESVILNTIFRTNDERRLYNISKNLLLLELFLRFRFTPENLKYYKENRDAFNTAEWKASFNDYIEKFRLDITLPEETSVIDNNMRSIEAFYDIASKRDDAFLRNSLQKMRAEDERIAVLIAGGFHTQNLTSLFRKNKISYVVLTPYVTQRVDDLLYDRILKAAYKTRSW